MSSRGQTDSDVEAHCLVSTVGRETSRPDQSQQRNSLTSIFWIPTVKSPRLILARNLSDHVHYYQGGLPFQYHIYHPESSTLRTEILGPDLAKGHKLQVIVTSGEWKCGDLLTSYQNIIPIEYCIIGEGVGPGFDFHDFQFVQEQDLNNPAISTVVQTLLKPYAYKPKTSKEEEFDDHYDENEKRKERAEDRM